MTDQSTVHPGVHAAPAVPPIGFDAALMLRGNMDPRRYTSYPAAAQFHIRFGELRLREAVAASNRRSPPRPGSRSTRAS